MPHCRFSRSVERAFGIIAYVTVPTFCALLVGCKDEAAVDDPAPLAKDVVVSVLSPQRVEMGHTSTQPATVHAFYTAEIHAKAAGYVTQLNADIGDNVAADAALAVISVPEMNQRMLRQQAAVKRLKAEQVSAAANLKVANANVASYDAMVTKAKADVGKTEAEIAAAKAELDRVTELVENKSVAERLLVEVQKKHDAALAEKTAAEAGVMSADANLLLAQAKVEAADAQTKIAAGMMLEAVRELHELRALMTYATLTAPFKGIVIERHVDLGDLVRNIQATSGNEKPLFVVAQIDPVRIRVAVPERDAPLATVGDVVRMTFPALGSDVIEWPVKRVAGALDESTRTMMVEIEVPNPDGRLLPGMFGEATISLDPPQSRIMLPANVVRFDEKGQSSVIVVDGSNEVHVVSVTTGLDDGELIEVTAGLSGNERIVGPTLRRLREGQKVRVQ